MYDYFIFVFHRLTYFYDRLVYLFTNVRSTKRIQKATDIHKIHQIFRIAFHTPRRNIIFSAVRASSI